MEILRDSYNGELEIRVHPMDIIDMLDRQGDRKPHTYEFVKSCVEVLEDNDAVLEMIADGFDLPDDLGRIIDVFTKKHSLKKEDWIKAIEQFKF